MKLINIFKSSRKKKILRYKKKKSNELEIWKFEDEFPDVIIRPVAYQTAAAFNDP